MGKKNKDKKKTVLVFDKNKRKEYLCGFRKRKNERKKKASEEMQSLLKAEKKRIKQENKEMYKKLVVSSRNIPDIEHLLQDEYEDKDVTVKIVELASDILEKKNLVIGENRPQGENVTVEKDIENDTKLSEHSENDTEQPISIYNDIKTSKNIKKILKNQATKKVQKSKVFQLKNKLNTVKNKKKSAKIKGNKSRNDKVKRKGGKRK